MGQRKRGKLISNKKGPRFKDIIEPNGKEFMLYTCRCKNCIDETGVVLSGNNVYYLDATVAKLMAYESYKNFDGSPMSLLNGYQIDYT